MLELPLKSAGPWRRFVLEALMKLAVMGMVLIRHPNMDTRNGI
jgi:hypothetical protein